MSSHVHCDFQNRPLRLETGQYQLPQTNQEKTHMERGAFFRLGAAGVAGLANRRRANRPALLPKSGPTPRWCNLPATTPDRSRSAPKKSRQEGARRLGPHHAVRRPGGTRGQELADRRSTAWLEFRSRPWRRDHDIHRSPVESGGGAPISSRSYQLWLRLTHAG